MVGVKCKCVEDVFLATIRVIIQHHQGRSQTGQRWIRCAKMFCKHRKCIKRFIFTEKRHFFLWGGAIPLIQYGGNIFLHIPSFVIFACASLGIILVMTLNLLFISRLTPRHFLYVSFLNNRFKRIYNYSIFHPYITHPDAAFLCVLFWQKLERWKIQLSGDT